MAGRAACRGAGRGAGGAAAVEAVVAPVAPPTDQVTAPVAVTVVAPVADARADGRRRRRGRRTVAARGQGPRTGPRRADAARGPARPRTRTARRRSSHPSVRRSTSPTAWTSSTPSSTACVPSSGPPSRSRRSRAGRATRGAPPTSAVPVPAPLATIGLAGRAAPGRRLDRFHAGRRPLEPAGHVDRPGGDRPLGRHADLANRPGLPDAPGGAPTTRRRVQSAQQGRPAVLAGASHRPGARRCVLGGTLAVPATPPADEVPRLSRLTGTGHARRGARPRPARATRINAEAPPCTFVRRRCRQRS